MKGSGVSRQARSSTSACSSSSVEANGLHHTPAEHGDVEDVASVVGLMLREEVEEQRCKPLGLQLARDLHVAGTEATGAAAMGEDDETPRLAGASQPALQALPANDHVLGGTFSADGAHAWYPEPSHHGGRQGIGMGPEEMVEPQLRGFGPLGVEAVVARSPESLLSAANPLV